MNDQQIVDWIAAQAETAHPIKARIMHEVLDMVRMRSVDAAWAYGYVQGIL